MRALLRRARTFFLPRAATRESRLLFAFTGGSGAWPGMGRALYRSEPVFRESIDASAAIVREVLGWDAASHFRGADDPQTTVEMERRNEIVRLGMLQLAQVDLWRAAGVRPAGVVSVSLGEMVAPYAAGALSRDGSARVLAAVAHAISRTSSDERMFVLRSDGLDALDLCRRAPAPLQYLGSSGTGSFVVICRARHAEPIRAFLAQWSMRELETDWNYHTPDLDVDRAWLREQLRDVETRPADCRIYSAAAGGAVHRNTAFDATFFAWMVSSPFRYVEAVSAALDGGFDAVVTLGPQPANNQLIESIAAARGLPVRFVDSMRADAEEGTWREAVTAVRELRRSPARRASAAADAIDAGDPFEWYEELRRDGAVHFIPRNRYWLVLGYDEVRGALHDAQRFSSDLKNEIDRVLLANDTAGHDAVRKILMHHFSPAAIARSTAVAERTAERLLHPLRAGRRLDVVNDYAQPLVATLAADLIGADADDAAALRETMRAAHGKLEITYARIQEIVRAVAGRSPVFATLVRNGLDEASARSLIRLLWVAGTTPQHAIGPAILLLLQHQDVRGRVQAQPALLPSFIDEALRLHPPAFLLPRRATETVVLGGEKIRAGEVVQLSLAAANRDPRHFDEPATLRLGRSPNAHLSFGGGLHHCIGASLGRAWIAAALHTLFRLAPDFHAVQPPGTVRWLHEPTLHGIDQLVIGA